MAEVRKGMGRTGMPGSNPVMERAMLSEVARTASICAAMRAAREPGGGQSAISW